MNHATLRRFTVPDLTPAASSPAGASADLAALASTAAGTGEAANGGDFAALFSQLSPSPIATAMAASTDVAGQKPGVTKSGSAPWSGGARRSGFDFKPVPARPATKAVDPSDPSARLALAGVLQVSTPQNDSVPPTLELPEAPPSGLPPGENDALDFSDIPGAGTGPMSLATLGSSVIPAPLGLAANDLLPETPASGEKKAEAGFSLPEAKASPADKPGAGPRADTGSRSAPLMSSLNPAIGQGEKFAEASAPFDRERDSREQGSEKKIQNLLDKRVANAQVSLGTDVAKPAPVMSTTSLLRPASPDSTSVAVTGAAATPDWLPPTSESAAATASQAHRAVEAVMTAADRVGSGEKQAVNLQFSFLDVSLAVHVELREGAVHTTFRTDSTELRSALAHEWQAVSSQVSDRPIKLADPVFAADHGGSGANSNSFAGDHARQQQQQQQQRDPTARAGLDFLSSTTARTPARSSASAADVAAPAGFTRRSTTTHLETFA